MFLGTRCKSNFYSLTIATVCIIELWWVSGSKIHCHTPTIVHFMQYWHFPVDLDVLKNYAVIGFCVQSQENLCMTLNMIFHRKYYKNSFTHLQKCCLPAVVVWKSRDGYIFISLLFCKRRTKNKKTSNNPHLCTETRSKTVLPTFVVGSNLLQQNWTSFDELLSYNN